MIKELSSKIIYNDFKEKMYLTDDELRVLDMLLAKYSIIKMADKIGMSDRNVGRVIKDIKDKYKNYKTLEIAKLGIFKS